MTSLVNVASSSFPTGKEQLDCVTECHAQGNDNNQDIVFKKSYR